MGESNYWLGMLKELFPKTENIVHLFGGNKYNKVLHINVINDYFYVK